MLPGAFLRSLGLARTAQLRQLAQQQPPAPELAQLERRLAELVDLVEGEYQLRPGVQLREVEALCLPPIDKRSPERWNASLRERQSYAEYRKTASLEACLYFLVSRGRRRIPARPAPSAAGAAPEPARPTIPPAPARVARQREKDEADQLRPDELAAREGWERVQRRAWERYCTRRWLDRHRPRRE